MRYCFLKTISKNSNVIRKLVCENLTFLRIDLDIIKNNIRSKEIRAIQTEKSNVKILIIPTNEELEIAQQVFKLI
ncbi:MAG TPA: hypothetical protein EYP87_00500 [Flavobacteriaceae bacterium]|nr:hypothetical protein [Flavobacteriaceae bacterium]